MSENITIEVDASSSLARHIEDLQRVITKRNAQIAELKRMISEAGEPEFIRRIRQKAYSEGYSRAASNLMEATRKFKDILDSVNKESFATYLEGDKIGWDNGKWSEIFSEHD